MEIFSIELRVNNDMSSTVFITGISSGLGLGFAQTYLEQGWSVYGISRRACPLKHHRLHHAQCDLSDQQVLPALLSALLEGLDSVDLVILNAGVLGEIRDLAETPLSEIRLVMDINVWANKLILDWFIAQRVRIDQAVAISSGAAVNGNRGWGAYALSKAALNMLTQLYAREIEETHFSALAPGFVDTAMQDYLCDANSVDASHYPSVEKLRAARGTSAMPGPLDAAHRLTALIPKLKEFPSGCFRDARQL